SHRLSIRNLAHHGELHKKPPSLGARHGRSMTDQPADVGDFSAPASRRALSTVSGPSSLQSLPRAGQYGCILADPPWAFATYSHPVEGRVPQRAARQHYDVVDSRDLGAFPVASLPGKDCAL